MQSCIILLVLLREMFRCAHAYHWAKANVTPQKWTKDTYECERSVTECAYFTRGFMGTLTVQNFSHSIAFSGNAPTPAQPPCNWAGLPPFWVISNTDHLT